MKLVFALLFLMKFFCVENRMISRNYKRDAATSQTEATLRYSIINFPTEPATSEEEEYEYDKVVAVSKPKVKKEHFDYDKRLFLKKLKEPCAIVVRSSMLSPSMQSLIRTYKYDATGALIPSSVKYFMKVPQSYGEPMLVPLHDKSVSHLGGFFRYYKEVPPIPQAW